MPVTMDSPVPPPPEPFITLRPDPEREGGWRFETNVPNWQWVVLKVAAALRKEIE